MKRLLSALISTVLLGAVLAFAACNAPSPDTPAPAALPESQKLAASATKPQQEESSPATDSPSDLPEESANGQPAEGPVRTWRLNAEEFVQRVHPAPWLDKTKTQFNAQVGATLQCVQRNAPFIQILDIGLFWL